jgi:putative ABC transport system permease protein
MLENMRISIQGIWSHKMRSFLTMLGIIIGIASIIAIVSTIKGTSEQIKEDLIGAGNNTVSVSLNYGDSDYDPEYGMTDGTAASLRSAERRCYESGSCGECDILLQPYIYQQRIL